MGARQPWARVAVVQVEAQSVNGDLGLSLAPCVSVEIRVVEGAGHFSFMNVPPPQTVEPLLEREAFLTKLASEMCLFVTS